MTKIEIALGALVDAVDVFDVNATIADEDLPHWNAVLKAKTKMKEEIEALLKASP